MRVLTKTTLNFKCDIVSTNLFGWVICTLYIIYEFKLVVSMVWNNNVTICDLVFAKYNVHKVDPTHQFRARAIGNALTLG